MNSITFLFQPGLNGYRNKLIPWQTLQLHVYWYLLTHKWLVVVSMKPARFEG